MLFLLLVSLIFVTPVRLTLLYDGKLTIDLRLWGLGGSFAPALATDNPARTQPLLRILGTWLRTDKARRGFHRHVRIISLHVLLRLHLEDAAQTCLLTGLLRQLCPLLPPKAHVRIQPEFLSPTRLQARCILFFHLGTIIITAARMLIAYTLEGHEHSKPRPKEA